MTKYKYIFLFLGLVFATSCSQNVVSNVQPTAKPTPTIVIFKQPTLESTSVATIPVTPTLAMTDYCLDCHENKQKLIDTAKPEEPKAESESEGVG